MQTHLMAGVPWNLKNKNKNNKKICSQSAVPEDTVGAEALERCNPCKSHGFSKKGKTASAVLLSPPAHTHDYLVLEVLTFSLLSNTMAEDRKRPVTTPELSEKAREAVVAQSPHVLSM